VRDEPLYWQYGSGSAIRDGKWKLVRARSTWELYDMSVDRTETNDLAVKYPDRVEQMGKQWNAWYKDCTGSEYQLAKKKKRKSK
jgi:arylsulfatase